MAKQESKDKSQKKEIESIPMEDDNVSKNDEPFIQLEERSQIDRLIEKILPNSGIEYITELSQSQINDLTILAIIADTYNLSILDELIKKFMLLMIPKERKRIKEIIELAKTSKEEMKLRGEKIEFFKGIR